MQKIIDANEVTIRGLLDSSSTAYRVPRHQRQFEWTIEQWSDLWNDIHEGKVEESHFLGSIVVIPEKLKLGINSFEVNDGQQRLTTTLILLSVIRDHAEKIGQSDYAKSIYDKYLTANYFEGGTKKVVPKMELGKLDKEQFADIVEGKLQKENKGNHRIYDCYQYFKEQIENLTADELFELTDRIVDKIILVHINVADQFNAFRLFETLNDRGLELTAVDLIKNHLLMKAASVDDVKVDTIVEEWQEMYEKVRNYDPVTFFYRFILSEKPGKFAMKQLYENITQRAKNEKWNAEFISEFTSKLNKAATIYTELIDASIGHPVIDRRLNDLKIFEASPSYTLLLKIVPLFRSNQISDKDLLRIIDLIEVFHIRWGVCGQSTSRLNDIYNRLCAKVASAEPKQVVSIVEDEYLTWAAPVNDSVFVSAMQEEFPQFSSARTKYIIWKLHNSSGETSLNFDAVHTEHILPQTLSVDWLKYLQEKTQLEKNNVNDFHDNLINKLGNLTLIKGEWNIAMSNKLFTEKKEEYKKSDIEFTNRLINESDWTFDQIVARTKNLAEQSAMIWKFEKAIPELLSIDVDKPKKERYLLSEDLKLFCKGPAADAVGQVVEKRKIRVLIGSKARKEEAPNFKDHNYLKLRNQLVEEGILNAEGESYIFASDYEFASASAAAAVVLGRSADGPSEWKDENGVSMYKLIDSKKEVVLEE
jgi:uncharacterized protein with ParB-like and HNH nuclease domain